MRDRIAAKTDQSAGPSGCWPYRGGDTTCRSGHRQVWDQGRMRNVHRVVWELEHGPIPAGCVIRHACDNPPCVNPAHLLIGSIADNNRDRDERGRHVPLKGSSNGVAKLTEKDIPEIRRLLSERVPQRQIARRFGVHQAVISGISRGKMWTHV